MRPLASILFAALAVCSHAQSLLGGIAGSGGGSSWIPSTLFSGLTGLGSVLNTDDIERPRDFEPRGFIGFGMSVQMASLNHSTGSADASSIPWLGGMVDGGIAVTFRDRFGFALAGTWGLNGYLLGLDSVTNSVYHASKRIEARAWLQQWPKRNKETVLKFGIGFGLTLQRSDELVRELNGYRAVTTAGRNVRPYLAPEFARIGASGKDRLEVALRYVVHLDGANAWETRAGLGTNTASYSASDNHVALITRYYIGKKRKALPPLPPPMVDFADRRTDTLATLHTHQHRIALRLWDDAEIDGDTISVFLNEVPVLSGYALTKDPLRLALDLRHGWNFLLVVAHNEGRVSPSTASCTVRRGKGKERLLIKTSRKHNQLVVFRCE